MEKVGRTLKKLKRGGRERKGEEERGKRGREERVIFLKHECS